MKGLGEFGKDLAWSSRVETFDHRAIRIEIDHAFLAVDQYLVTAFHDVPQAVNSADNGYAQRTG